MHPINTKFFGINGIGLLYNNGSSVVLGYIVKQLGAKTFIVTSDGTTTYVVQLADSISLAGSLTPGYCTILINNYSEYVSSIWGSLCGTLQGNEYRWSIDVSIDGSYIIASMGNYLPGPVTNLSALLPTLTNANITFSAPSTGGPVFQYVIEYRQSGTSGSWLTALGSPVVSPGTFAIFGLSEGVSYDVRVAARGNYGLGPYTVLGGVSIL